MGSRTKVLFVCIGNACRSQIAEALARHIGSDVIEAASAGVAPLGRITEFTSEVLRELGVRLDGQYSKGLDDLHSIGPDLIVNLSGTPVEHLFPGREILNWDVKDPLMNGPLDAFRRAREEIDGNVRKLVRRLRIEQ
jgi:protein-tyrosine-phosphatase